MATLGGTALTLLDIHKQMDPDGQIARIIEVLTQTNEILHYLTFEECNDGDSHQLTIRTGIPEGTFRRYNQGVGDTKGTTAQVRAQTCMLEAKSNVDRDLARKGGQEKKVRANNAVAHIMGLNQQVAGSVVYDDERVNVERMTGLAAHYSTVNTAVAASAENVIDGGGAGSDNTSIYLTCFGPLGVTGLFPTGSTAGLKHEDRGEVEVIDATGTGGASYIALQDRFQWKYGLAVADWRRCVRICNIDVSALRAQSGAIELVEQMIRASEMLGNKMLGNCAWVMNRTVSTALRLQKLDRNGMNVSFETVEGKRVMVFDDIPIARTDALLNTEAQLT